MKKAMLFIPNVLYFFFTGTVEIAMGFCDKNSREYQLKTYAGIYAIIDLILLFTIFNTLQDLPIYQIVLIFALAPLIVILFALFIMSFFFGGLIPHKFGIWWVDEKGRIYKIK